jgi:hypothetical protein
METSNVPINESDAKKPIRSARSVAGVVQGYRLDMHIM